MTTNRSIKLPVAMVVLGYSLSPGGLLLPYHLGALDALQYYSWLDETNPIAGSSAGAIAAATFGCGLDPQLVLESTIAISDTCKELGGARGRLLPLLRQKLYDNIGNKEIEVLRSRTAPVAIAYREVFPLNRPILQTSFTDRQDLVNAVCFSSTFPFFATNWPCSLDPTTRLYPRFMVDGFFTVERNRFGCPEFHSAGLHADRTVTISVFPQEAIGLSASPPEDCISPTYEDVDQLQRLIRLATESSSRDELNGIYESGWADAEKWCRSQQVVSDTLMKLN